MPIEITKRFVNSSSAATHNGSYVIIEVYKRIDALVIQIQTTSNIYGITELEIYSKNISYIERLRIKI